MRLRGPAAEVFLERVAGAEPSGPPETIARGIITPALSPHVRLRIEGNGRSQGFSYATPTGPWITLKENEDGSILSTAVAGGFVGTYIGLHARIEP